MSTNPYPIDHPDVLACDEAFDLLGAYALDALDAEEQAAVALHLAECPRCRAELARMEGVVGLLGQAAPTAAPPSALRSRLLDEIRLVVPDPAPAAYSTSAPAGAIPAPVPFPRRPQARGIVLSPWAAAGLGLVAAILIIAVIGAGVLLRQAQTERDEARQGQSEVAEYLHNGGLVTALAPVAGAAPLLGEGSGSLIVAPHQPKAMLVVYGMPATKGSQRYQVWVERAGQRTPVATLDVDAEGAGWLIVSTPQPLVSYDLMGVSLVQNDRPATALLSAQIPHGQAA